MAQLLYYLLLMCIKTESDIYIVKQTDRLFNRHICAATLMLPRFFPGLEALNKLTHMLVYKLYHLE